MKFLFYLLVLLFLTSCAFPTLATRLTSPHIQEIQDKTVALVFPKSEDETRVYCTGVWVGNSVILTAHHCLTGVLRYINSQKGAGEQLSAEIGFTVHYVMHKEEGEVGKVVTAMHLGTCIGVDSTHDLALIRAEGNAIPPHPYAELASQSPAIGETVSGMGHPLGLYWSYVQGVVSTYRTNMPEDENEQGPYLQVSIPIWYGNSGGGLFDYQGKLVGIASFIAPGPNLAFYIHVTSIKDFLKAQKVL